MTERVIQVDRISGCCDIAATITATNGEVFYVVGGKNLVVGQLVTLLEHGDTTGHDWKLKEDNDSKNNKES